MYIHGYLSQWETVLFFQALNIFSQSVLVLLTVPLESPLDCLWLDYQRNCRASSKSFATTTKAQQARPATQGISLSCAASCEPVCARRDRNVLSSFQKRENFVHLCRRSTCRNCVASAIYLHLNLLCTSQRVQLNVKLNRSQVIIWLLKHTQLHGVYYIL